jgi:cytochrome P450
MPRRDSVGPMLILFSAGVDTAYCLIKNAIRLLNENHDQRRRLVEEPDLLPGVIGETVPLLVTHSVHCQTTRRDVEFPGETIPAGARVALLFGGGEP